MAKKKKPKPVTEYRPNIELEDRRAVAITVAWMLATLSCTVASLCWLIAWFVAWRLKPPGEDSPLALIPNSLWFISLVTGVLALILMPAAYRWRQVPPPRAIAIYSVAIGLVPIVGLFVTKLIERAFE